MSTSWTTPRCIPGRLMILMGSGRLRRNSSAYDFMPHRKRRLDHEQCPAPSGFPAEPSTMPSTR